MPTYTERFIKIAHQAAKSIILWIIFALLMSGIIMFFSSATTFAAAFHISLIFMVLHRVASARQDIENKWDFEQELKKELEKPDTKS